MCASQGGEGGGCNRVGGGVQRYDGAVIAARFGWWAHPPFTPPWQTPHFALPATRTHLPAAGRAREQHPADCAELQLLLPAAATARLPPAARSLPPAARRLPLPLPLPDLPLLLPLLLLPRAALRQVRQLQAPTPACVWEGGACSEVLLAMHGPPAAQR